MQDPPGGHPPELRAVIDEAHRLRRRVAGHGYGGEGVDVALDAGIDSIEHGALLSSAQLERMAAQGTFLVLTTSAVAESDPRIPARTRAMMAEANAQYHDTIRRALEAGMQLALGSDCVHGRIDREILLLARLGASPKFALEAATANAAALIQRDDLGHIRPGGAADFPFAAGDPLQEPAVLSFPQAVMQAGVWLRPPPVAA